MVNLFHFMPIFLSLMLLYFSLFFLKRKTIDIFWTSGILGHIIDKNSLLTLYIFF